MMNKSTLVKALIYSTALAAVGCSEGKSNKAPDRQNDFPRTPVSEPDTRTATTPVIDLDAEPIAEPATPLEPTIAEPETFREFYDRGKELLGSGEYRAALEDFQAAAEMQPKNLQARIQVARASLELGDLGAARESAEMAIDIDVESSFAWNTMGRIELAEGDLEAAVVSFERAADENEDNSFAWNNLGYSLIELGRYSEAAEALESATSGAAPTGYMWNNLGMAYEHLGEVELARSAYRQGADLGSFKAEVNFDRLEGVTEIFTEDSDDIGDDFEIGDMDSEAELPE